MGKAETTLHELYAVFQYNSFVPLGLSRFLEYLESENCVTIKRKTEVKGYCRSFTVKRSWWSYIIHYFNPEEVVTSVYCNC